MSRLEFPSSWFFSPLLLPPYPRLPSSDLLRCLGEVTYCSFILSTYCGTTRDRVFSPPPPSCSPFHCLALQLSIQVPVGRLRPGDTSWPGLQPINGAMHLRPRRLLRLLGVSHPALYHLMDMLEVLSRPAHAVLVVTHKVGLLPNSNVFWYVTGWENSLGLCRIRGKIKLICGNEEAPDCSFWSVIWSYWNLSRLDQIIVWNSVRLTLALKPKLCIRYVHYIPKPTKLGKER